MCVLPKQDHWVLNKGVMCSYEKGIRNDSCVVEVLFGIRPIIGAHSMREVNFGLP